MCLSMKLNCYSNAKTPVVLRGPETLVSRITGLAGSLFTNGEPHVLGHLMQAVDRWAEIVGQDAEGRPLVPCPIQFTEEERAQKREDQLKWEEGVEAMDEILRGWVRQPRRL